MEPESYTDYLKNKAIETLRLNEKHRKEMLFTAGILAYAGIRPFFRRSKKGQKKSKFDPAGVISLVALGAILFNLSKKGSPEILQYRQCKISAPEEICRARYVVASVQGLIPDLGY